MTDDGVPRGLPTRLSEDAAHTLLARAIELDRSRGSETTVADLRDVANEAGISGEAFDLALGELNAQLPATTMASYSAPRRAATTLWNSLRGRDTPMPHGDFGGVTPQTVWDAIISNTAAFVLTWLLILVMTRITQPMGWQAMDVTMLASEVLGLGIARRLRARVVELAFAGFIAFSVAELAMHLIFGIRSVQGGPTHMGVMIAGILGVVIGIGVARRSRTTNAPAVSPVATTANAASEPKSPPNDSAAAFRLGIAFRTR
jgi:hypothetical protein